MSKLAIATYEARRLARDPAVPVLLVLFLCLSVYAGWNGADWVEKRETAITSLATEEAMRKADMRRFVEQAYPSITMPPSYALLPPGSMAALSVGQADNYPYHAEIVPLGDYTSLLRRVWADIGNPTLRAAGRFDLAFVIVFLLPLVILAASYDLWSRERERGIAAMVLSQPITLSKLVAMKALARGVVVLLPATAILLFVTALAAANSLVNLLMLALVVFAYGSFWLVVAVLISFVAHRSTEAAVASGAIWLLVVVMAPSLSLTAVDLLAPAPSEMRFATDMKIRIADITERQRIYRESNPTPTRIPAPTLPDRLRDIYVDRVALDSEIAPMIEAHQRAKDFRRDLLDKLRFVLPSVAVQDALDRIAGSDADRAIAFQEQAREAQLELRRVHKEFQDRDTQLTPEEYDNLPGFQFRENGRVIQSGVLADLVALLVISITILTAARALRGRAAAA